MAYDTINHKEYVLPKFNKISVISALILWSLFLAGTFYAFGSAHQKALFTAKNKPLTALSVANSAPVIDLEKASNLAKDKKFDEAIALLTPQVSDAKKPTSIRAQGMNLIGQYFQAKSDPESALKWYLMANNLAGAPRLDSLLGAGSASAQLYALKSTGPDGPKGAQSYKNAAIGYYQDAKKLSTDSTVTDQIEKQIQSLQKAQ